jgi:hypothetical protein
MALLQDQNACENARWSAIVLLGEWASGRCQRPPTIAPAVVAAIVKALALDPAGRYANAGELADAIAACATATDVPTPAPASRRRTMLLIGVPFMAWLYRAARITPQRGDDGHHGPPAERNPVEVVESAAQTRDRLLGLEERLRGGSAQGADELGPDGLELLQQERLAGHDLVRLGCAIAGGPTFDDIADVYVLPAEAHRLDDLGEELPGAAHERLALGVLIGARRLAHEDQAGRGVSDSEDDLGAPGVQLAAGALAQFYSDLLQGRADHRGRGRRLRPAEVGVFHAELLLQGEMAAHLSDDFAQFLPGIRVHGYSVSFSCPGRRLI